MLLLLLFLMQADDKEDKMKITICHLIHTEKQIWHLGEFVMSKWIKWLFKEQIMNHVCHNGAH